MANAIITKEIVRSAAFRQQRAKECRSAAADLLNAADKDEAISKLQLECDEAQAHVFKTVEGSGMCGDRFEEECIHCGWIHTS